MLTSHCFLALSCPASSRTLCNHDLLIKRAIFFSMPLIHTSYPEMAQLCSPCLLLSMKCAKAHQPAPCLSSNGTIGWETKFLMINNNVPSLGGRACPEGHGSPLPFGLPPLKRVSQGCISQTLKNTNPGDLVNMQILMQYFWVEDPNSAHLTSSLVMFMLLFHGTHCK